MGEQNGGCEVLSIGEVRETFVKWDQFPVSRWRSSGDLMCSMMTVVTITALYT